VFVQKAGTLDNYISAGSTWKDCEMITITLFIKVVLKF